MFWLGMLAGGIIGGALTLAFHCMLIVAKEADNREYSDEHFIK